MSESGLTAGTKLRAAVKDEQPLQVVGAINAYHARMAERVGYRAIYLSGGGVAAGSLGIPDLGISTIDDVLTDVRRITDVCSLPLLVDADTGFGGAFNLGRRGVISKTRWGRSGVGIVRGKRLCRVGRWWTALRRRWTLGGMTRL